MAGLAGWAGLVAWAGGMAGMGLGWWHDWYGSMGRLSVSMYISLSSVSSCTVRCISRVSTNSPEASDDGKRAEANVLAAQPTMVGTIARDAT